MKKYNWKICITFTLVVMATGYSMVGYSDSPDNYKAKQTKALRAPVYEELMKAQELQEAGKLTEALSVLDQLKNRSGRRALQAHEFIQLYNFYAYVYLGMEKYPDAIKAFEQVLKQTDVTLGLAQSTKYTLAQLYISTGNIKTGIQVLNDWFDITEKYTPAAYVLLSQAYLQDKQINKALPPLLEAFKLAKQQGKPEKENWYSLLQFIYAEKKDYKKQRDVLEILVNRWPKKNYWLALVGVYSELNQESLQLYALESAYMQGMLDRESYLVNLAQMLAAEGTPFRAAKVMEKGIADKKIAPTEKNLERLADYWRRSQELDKAIPYQIQAAKLSNNGEASLRLAGMYLTQYKDAEAVNAISQALKKGQLKNTLDAQMLLGQASFQSAKFDQADKAFNQIITVAKKAENKNNKKVQRLAKIARQWKTYMKTEITRQKEIKQYLQG